MGAAWTAAARLLSARGLLLWLLLAAAAGWAHRQDFRFTEPLTRATDVDGHDKLAGIARRPGVDGLLSYFVGDDPQGVHTFRPLPAAVLWLEWHLWGWCRWAYQLVNLALFALVGVRLVRLAEQFSLPATVAGGVGFATMLARTDHTGAIILGIATLHDLLAGLASVVAVELALAWLRDGRSNSWRGFLAVSAAAYLCKESALALLPLSVALAGVIKPPAEPGRRRLALVGAAFGTALGWFIWYRLAERNMGLHPDEAHTFGGLWLLLKTRWPNSLANLLWVLCPPFGDLALVWASEPPLGGLLTLGLYEASFALVLLVMMLVVLWRTDHRLLLFIYAWRLAHMLPVLPLNSTWPWYHFAPRLVDALLYLPGLAALATRWRRDPRWLVAAVAWRAITFGGATFGSGHLAVRWYAPEVALFDLIVLWFACRAFGRQRNGGLSERESSR